MSNQEPVKRVIRVKLKKSMQHVDLNAAPPSDSRSQEETSRPSIQRTHASPAQPPPIDVEAFDDDVVISSPRAFAAAKNNSRRSRRPTAVVDLESEERASRRRLPASQQTINGDLNLNLDGKGWKNDVLYYVPAPSPPPPKELELACPICIGPFVEEMTTKCGHIFCKKCIMAAIAVQPKCPACRKKTTARDIIRIFLPSSRA